MEKGQDNGTHEDTTNSTDLCEVQGSSSSTQKSSSTLDKTGSPEGLIHDKKDSDGVHETETITKEVDGVEEIITVESSDNDEELLGLRLMALSSALVVKDNENTDVTKRMGTRKKKLKNLTHRVKDSPGKKKTGHRKRSRVAESRPGRRAPLPSYVKSK